MRQLKGCRDGSASTAWDYAGLLCYLYSLGWRDQAAGPKRCHYSQTSRAKSLLDPFYAWYNMLLTDWVALFPRSQHSPLPILKFFIIPLNLPPLLLPLTCTRVTGNNNKNSRRQLLVCEYNIWKYVVSKGNVVEVPDSFIYIMMHIICIYIYI